MESNDKAFLTLDEFQALESAIFDENIDKEIQYDAAILLAVSIFEYNLNKNLSDFQATPKECKSPSCIDKFEIYTVDTLEIKTGSLDSKPKKHKAPIGKIRLILNQAVNQEEDLLYRFLAASVMPYIRETPSKYIINILVENLINLPGISNPDSEEEPENNNLIQQALDSLQLFSEYTDDSSYFEDVIPALNNLIMSELYRTRSRLILGNLAAMGNQEAFKNLTLLVKTETHLKYDDVFPLEIATDNQAVTKIMSTENQDEINLLKVFISQLNNDDNLAVGSVASILMSVGEEQFLANLLEEDILDKIKLKIAETLYNNSDDEAIKKTALISIINLYKINSEWDDGNPDYPAWVLYSIGQPSVENLREVIQENSRNEKLKSDSERLLKFIDKKNNNRMDETRLKPFVRALKVRPTAGLAAILCAGCLKVKTRQKCIEEGKCQP